MSPSERSVMLREFGRMEEKINQLIQYHEEQKDIFKTIEHRISSLEDTRIKQRAYWKAVVATGGLVVTLLGKLALFTHKP